MTKYFIFIIDHVRSMYCPAAQRNFKIKISLNLSLLHFSFRNHSYKLMIKLYTVKLLILLQLLKTFSEPKISFTHLITFSRLYVLI